MEKIRPPEKNLLIDTIEICCNNKIKMVIVPQKTHQRASGWVKEGEFLTCFDPDGDYASNWGIFVHESCHVDQLIDKDSIWHEGVFNADQDWLDVHTRGKTRKSKKIETYFRKLMELELDCDRRAVEKIKKYGLNINIKEYIRSSNVYMFSYYCFYHQKCWYDGEHRIYDQKEILKQMPTKHLKPNEYWTKIDCIYDFLKKNNNRS